METIMTFLRIYTGLKMEKRDHSGHGREKFVQGNSEKEKCNYG